VEMRNRSLEKHFPSSEKMFWVTSDCRLPALLYTSLESRTEALKHYKFYFGLEPKIYVDFSKDITFFGIRYSLNIAFGSERDPDQSQSLHDLEKIRSLAVEHTFPRRSGLLVDELSALEEVVCVRRRQYFELGSEPRLMWEEYFHEEVGRDTSSLGTFWQDFRQKREREPDWKVPEIRKGLLLRGRGDKNAERKFKEVYFRSGD
jgi:hypothetical protein